MVIFLIGEDSSNNSVSPAQVYSPYGKCDHILASVTNLVATLMYGALTIFNNQVLTCGGTQNLDCFLYNPGNNSWSKYTQSSKAHGGVQGVVHQGKIYMPDDNGAEMFDPVTMKWSPWPWSYVGYYATIACFVSWKSVILRFGGSQLIASYDPATQIWTTITMSSMYSLDWCSCITLPNNNILVTGVTTPNTVAEYNVTAGTWSPLLPAASLATTVRASRLVSIGARVFIILPDFQPFVMEYDYNSKRAFNASNPFKISIPPYKASQAVAVPARWFSRYPGGCVGIE